MQSPDKQNRQTKTHHDLFCWTCHKDNPNLFCSTCVRAFHIVHVKKAALKDESVWRCQECIDMDKGVSQIQMDREYLNHLLKCVSELLIADEYLAERFLDVEYKSKQRSVCNPLDLSKIGEKAERCEYTSIEGFWCDIKWIEHNTKVHRSGEKRAVEALKWLNSLTKNELYTIRLCHECYRNANHNTDWFTMPCERPHLLLWVQQKGYPYWPAKLMAVNSDKHTVDVQFFGEHERMILKPDDSICYLYSEKCPSNQFGLWKVAWEKAVQEAREYIQNLAKKFGSFNYAPPNTILNKNKLDRHLFDMVPKALEAQANSGMPSPISKSGAANVSSRRMTMAMIFADGKSRRKAVSVRRRKSDTFDANEDELDIEDEFIRNDDRSNPKRKLINSTEVEAESSAKRQKIDEPSTSSSEDKAIDIETDHRAAQPTPIGSPTVSSAPPCKPASTLEQKAQLASRARKSFPNSVPCTSNISSTFSHRPMNETSSSTATTEHSLKDEPITLSDVSSIDNIVLHFSGSDGAESPHPSICKQNETNALPDSSKSEMFECICPSLKLSLGKLTAAADAVELIKLLQIELEKQRLENDLLVRTNNQLTKKNNDLAQDLAAVNRKLDLKNMEVLAVNKELTDSLENFKVKIGRKCDQITGECAMCCKPCGDDYCSLQCADLYRKFKVQE